MIIASAPFIAERPPVTDFAVLYRFGIRGEIVSRSDGPLETRFDEPVVREKIVRSKCFWLEFSFRRDDVHRLRHETLNAPNKVGIQAELEDRPTPSLAGQLGVDDFIRPIP